ncbi:MAG: DUF1460 domain-containing protein [Bacteroides sp.]|nr:DUF1460 domain-containing protein [Bacteroides sp.]
MNHHRILTLIAAAAIAVTVAAAPPSVEWRCEATDTAAVTELLTGTAARRFDSPGARTAHLARAFTGRPYKAGTLEGAVETLRVNLDSLDCTTLVDNVMALSYTLGERRTGWQDFVYNLTRLRYRGGHIDGYPSRLHYIADWAVDNIHRGNFDDVTRDTPKTVYMVRTIDFMSAHRDRYPALADSATLARVKRAEDALRGHRFPYVKTRDAADRTVLSRLREGDIVAFVSNLKDLDVTHMGILVRKSDGQLHVLHASSSQGSVVVSPQPLADFLRRNRQWIGFRAFRLRD